MKKIVFPKKPKSKRDLYFYDMGARQQTETIVKINEDRINDLLDTNSNLLDKYQDEVVKNIDMKFYLFASLMVCLALLSIVIYKM